MKRFSKFLAEDRQLALAKQYTAAASDSQGEISVFDIANPDAIDRLNFAISEAISGTVANPYTLIQRVRNKLATVGLHFEIAQIPEIPDHSIDEKGSPTIIETPLTQWGGRLGYLEDNTGEVTRDDGISKTYPGGLNIRFEFQKRHGRINIDAHILPGESAKE